MEKIARICWNTHDWKRPSGSEGKSRVDSSYEKSVGFGHEEWLLDDTRIMPDGYHYGFLQPMNVTSGKHIGEVYDIHLFAIAQLSKKSILDASIMLSVLVLQKVRKFIATIRKRDGLKR